jgi:hypothetical protein
MALWPVGYGVAPVRVAVLFDLGLESTDELVLAIGGWLESATSRNGQLSAEIVTPPPVERADGSRVQVVFQSLTSSNLWKAYMVDFISFVRDHYESLPEPFAIVDLVGGVQRPLASGIGDD